MKKITKKTFLKKIKEHSDFSDCDLSGFSVANAKIDGIGFYKCKMCDFSDCTFDWVTFDTCDFNEDYLTRCTFENCDFQDSDLHNVSIDNSTFKECDFMYARITSAWINESKFDKSSFCEAVLTDADFSNCKFIDVKYDESTSNFALNCPEKGAFTAFKKAELYDGQRVIVELKVPAKAKRSSATSRKCRVSEAKVVAITSLDGKVSYKCNAYAMRTKFFVYTIGKTVKVANFETNRWDECAPGIHCFITRQEAVNY